MKDIFGGRVRLMISGSAPISKEVVDFLKICVQCPFIEGYGSTECMGYAFAQHHQDNSSGNVGGPIAGLHLKLENVKELNYYWGQKLQNGEIKNQGEICLKGDQVFKGYYKSSDQTKEVLDENGWFHTGDIGELMPNGTMKIIDRKKNIFKLAQGEYIAPDKLESIFSLAEGVSDVLVYGSPLKAFLVGLVYPNEKYVLELAKELQIKTESFKELCKVNEISSKILSNIRKISQQKKLAGFEFLSTITLIPTPFGEIDNGSLVTPSQKIKRKIAENYFKEVFDKMYSEIEEVQWLTAGKSPKDPLKEYYFFPPK